MKYNAPPGSLDPDAPFSNGLPGLQKGSPIPAEAVEYTQREIVAAIAAAGLTPDNNDLTQLWQAMQKTLKPVMQYGILPWSALTDYPVNGLAMGLDGAIYQAVQPSGPGNGGAQDTSISLFWDKKVDYRGAFPSDQEISFSVPASGSVITSPVDGWVAFEGQSTSTDSYLQIRTAQGHGFNVRNTQSGTTAQFVMSVRQGMVLTVNYLNMQSMVLAIVKSVGSVS